MDVNHDLIAAGHPRMRFEFAAYHSSYPKHWRDDTLGTDFEARAWFVGQLVTAQAALELLQHRASLAESRKNPKPWPEFAEHNCAACHHDLRPLSERQKGGFGPGTATKLPIPWGTWPYAMLPALREAPGLPRAKVDLSQLEKLMRRRSPNSKEVSAEAAKQARAVGAWLDAATRTPALTGPQLARLLRHLAEDRSGLASTFSDKDRRRGTWDGSTQLYLGLAAVYHGWGDVVSPAKPPAPTRKALEDLRKALEASFPSRGASTIYDSPDQYSPAELQRPLSELRKQRK
jgi:hypothetical protein